MPSTIIADIIEPDVFIPYVIERTAERSTLVQSGIVIPDSSLDILAQKGGRLIDMPFFKDLTGNDQILDDENPLSVKNITTAQDVARLHLRGDAWGVNDLAEALSGDDPLGAIVSLVADYWNRKEQALLIATLNGVFGDNAANDSGDLIHDASLADASGATAVNLMGKETVVAAAFKLGDAASKLTAIAMHSVPYSRLILNDLIEFIPDSEGKMTIPTYLGKRVIVDDGCPVAAVTNGYRYTSYLFGQGAVGRGEGNAPVPVETDRDSLQGDDILVHRRHFILHLRGIRWLEASITGTLKSPSNTDVALAVNWDRVYEQKNIRCVQLLTNG